MLASIKHKHLVRLVCSVPNIFFLSTAALFAQNVAVSPTAAQVFSRSARSTNYSTALPASNFSNVRYVTSSWNWSQSPSDDLSKAGQGLTIHLAPCPLGLDTSTGISHKYYVYISGTGSPEAVPVTGGSCAAGSSSGKIIVNTSYDHTGGYIVGSASGGWQEAINDAQSQGIPISPNELFGLNSVVGTPATVYNIYAPVFVKSGRLRLSAYGSFFNCYTRSTCFFNSDEQGNGGPLWTIGNTWEGFTLQSEKALRGVFISSVQASKGVYTITTSTDIEEGQLVNGDWVTIFYSTPARTQNAQVQISNVDTNTFQYKLGTSATFPPSNGYGWVVPENAAFEDNGQNTVYRDITVWNTGKKVKGIYQSFSWGIVFDNDQAFKVDGFVVTQVQCSPGANFCGAGIYGRGDSRNAAVGDLQNLTISTQCGGNGVYWPLGNGLHLTGNNVIQGFNQYGIYYHGGLQPLTINGNYEESVASCPNVFYPDSITAAAGVIAGSETVIQSDDPVGGAVPGAGSVGGFPVSTSGNQFNSYYIVIKGHGRSYSPPLYIGSSQPTCSTATCGTVRVSWPEPLIDSSTIASPVTFDLYVVTTSGSAGSNSVTAPVIGLDASLVDGNIVCGGSMANAGICTYTDTQGRRIKQAPQSVVSTSNLWFWPGALVLSGGATFHIPTCYQNTAIVTTSLAPSVFCNRAEAGGASAGFYNNQHGPYFASYLSGDSSVNNPSVGATLKNSSTAGGAASSAQKGLLNFINFGALGQTDILTLADCTPFLTISTGGYRPAWSQCDTAIGFDSRAGTPQQNAGLSLRAPLSITDYINSLPTGSDFKERLTSTQKTFNVVVNGVVGFEQNGTALGLYCGTTTSCSNTAEPLVRQIYGRVTLSSGTVTVTGFSPPFASSTSFVCTGTDATSTAAVKIVNVSPSSITITGTGTDTVGYICIGA